MLDKEDRRIVDSTETPNGSEIRLVERLEGEFYSVEIADGHSGVVEVSTHPPDGEVARETYNRLCAAFDRDVYTITQNQAERLRDNLARLDEITKQNSDLVWGSLNILDEIENDL